ncbi:MAG: FAD-dependent monooxygenase [Bacteroidota bacterium]
MIDIIGGGIGGLTTAVALGQKGIPYRVFEQAAQLKPLGAGIILANNAMQVYDKLGLRKEIEQAGNPISFLKITTPQLNPLYKVDLSFFEHKYGVKNVAIHRGALQNILLNHIDKGSLRLDHKLNEITPSQKGFKLVFENGQEVISETLLGADGIHSSVRKALFQNTLIRSAGQTCWRGVAEYDLPLSFQHELNEAWGAGIRFGFVQISTAKVYWFAVKSMQSGEELSVEELAEEYRHFHPLVQEILAHTPTSHIHTATLDDLKSFSPWWKANVCLLGDAAHATTPNMGQGACQAIEDAYVLAQCMRQHPNTDEAFSSFQRLRKAKAHMIVKSSWQIGRMAHWKNPLAISMRNLMMKSVPASLNRKQSERIFELGEVYSK